MTPTIQQFFNSIPDKRAANILRQIFSRVLMPNGTDTAITATAGGVQATAIPLKPQVSFHEVTTVATAADAVLLPPAIVGENHFVKNSGANAMQVFGSGTDTIDSVATATGVSQLPGDAVIYVCMVAGNYIRWGGVQVTEAFDAITANSIAGTDSSLDITGQAAAQGGATVLRGGTSSTSGNAGGASSVTGGTPGATGIGGAALITGGIGGATSGTGGDAKLTGGAATAGNAVGGAATVTGGAGQGSGAGGAVTITSGAAGATGVAGAVNIAVGAATAGAGSTVTITGGNGAGGTAAGGNVNIVPGTAVSTGIPGEWQVNGNSGLSHVALSFSATDASRAVFICTRPMRLKACSSMFTTASTSGTWTVEKLTGTTAAGSGTALLTGTVALSGSANTVANGTLIATVASLTFAAGDRVSIVIAGTMTNLVGAIGTITLTPV